MNKINHAQITNDLTTKVSKFENKQVKFRGVASRKVGKIDHNGKGPKNSVVCTSNGSVFTIFYPNWRELSE